MKGVFITKVLNIDWDVFLGSMQVEETVEIQANLYPAFIDNVTDCFLSHRHHHR